VEKGCATTFTHGREPSDLLDVLLVILFVEYVDNGLSAPRQIVKLDLDAMHFRLVDNDAGEL
jgi:hypothetical protein